MTQVYVDLSMSLDGYIAGPNDSPGKGLGDGGERLHEWIFENADTEPAVHGGTTFGSNAMLDEMFARTGASIVGRRTFDLAEGEWGDNPPFEVPVFIVTHRPRETVAFAQTSYTFVTDGIQRAYEQASAAAGDQWIGVMGASIAQQFIRVRLVDELQIHLIPILLGGGVRLFEQLGDTPIELDKTRVIDASGVTHLTYRVHK